jgi:anti-sigma regulatory factor (Ser/Thr protein kinase)
MNPNVSRIFAVSESSQVGEIRRLISHMAGELTLTETERGRVAIIAAEFANNLWKYAKSGELICRQLHFEGATGIEMISVDRGPGMNLGECLRDGFSTGGSPGTGLGAVLRLSTVFDSFSIPGQGSVLLSQVWSADYGEKSRQSMAALDYGVVCTPIRGETECGDNWAVSSFHGRNLLLVADGLGHGPLAAEASGEAVRIFDRHPESMPGQILSFSHDALKKTRGAAVAIAELGSDHKTVTFSGTGNISAAVTTSVATLLRRMVSHPGTVGARMSKPREFQYEWDRDSQFILHSDGISTHWKLEIYPGLLSKHPSILATILYRDYKRGTDDVTVLCAKERAVVSQ